MKGKRGIGGEKAAKGGKRRQKEAKGVAALAAWAFMIGVLGLLVGYGLIFTFAQQPDGDSTALALFEAQYGGQGQTGQGQTGQGQALPLRYRVGNSLWFNGAGALFVWGTLYFFLYSLTALDSSRQSIPIERSRKLWTPFWLSLLMIWAGWAWNQTRGWQGELYLEPGVEKFLGVDQKPTIVFERFLLPPAPLGVGRALELRLLVEGQPYDIAAAMPYKGASWTLTPRWYGAILKAKDLVQPLFFGASGASEGFLRDGSKVSVTVNVEELTVSSIPPLQEVELTHYAILYARFAPGDRLLRLGGVMLMMLVVYCLCQVALAIIKRQ